ncbi:MAG: hypothetical protein KJI69_03220, partial [Patescibacteria group bacterium]|nr:hypothetical protein [Patescibacteria group bacterium]
MPKFISLQQATEYCDYTQEYLSLRARQKKLKARKIGRNWVTTIEWLQEYVESVEGKLPESTVVYEFISLEQATEYCDYTQEYLSLRARQKKLKAQKIGRNWVTTKEWLKEYVESIDGYNRNIKKVASQPRRVEHVSPLPFETEFKEIVKKPIRFPSFKLAGVVALLLLFVFTGAFGKEGILSLLEKIDEEVQEFSQAVDNRIITALEFDYTIALKQTAAVAVGGAETLGEGFIYSAQNPAAVGEITSEYINWLQTSIIELPREVSRTYVSFDGKVAKGIETDVQSISEFGNSIKNRIQNGIRSIVSIPQNIFSNITIGTEEVLVVQEQPPVEKEVVEVVKEVEVERIVQIQQVKEIVTEVRTIDSAALTSIQAQLSTVLAWKTDIDNLKLLTAKLQATPPTATQTAAAVYPVYVGSVGLQVGGNGNFDSLGVSGSAGIRDLGVGRSATFGNNSSDVFTVNSTATFASSVTISAATTLSSLNVSGNTILGDDAADTLTINASIASLTAQATDFDIKDNTASSFTISEAANDYINITTTDDSETLIFGNAATNPSYSFLGTGTLTVSGGGSLTGTWSDLGTVTTIDIDGGTIDTAVIGGVTPAVGTFTTLAGTTSVVAASDITITSGSIISASAAISFGDENLTTTGTLASGALTVTGSGSVTTSMTAASLLAASNDSGAIGAAAT